MAKKLAHLLELKQMHFKHQVSISKLVMFAFISHLESGSLQMLIS